MLKTKSAEEAGLEGYKKSNHARGDAAVLPRGRQGHEPAKEAGHDARQGLTVRTSFCRIRGHARAYETSDPDAQRRAVLRDARTRNPSAVGALTLATI